MNMTLSFLFWAVFASYVVHIPDETLIGGGFVAKVQERFWPAYTARILFFFNAAFLVTVVACILAYDAVGSAVLFLPLALAILLRNATGVIVGIADGVLFSSSPTVRRSLSPERLCELGVKLSGEA